MLFAAVSAHASVFETTPYDLEMSQGQFTGPDVAGGSFTADDDYLTSFTLWAGAIGGNPNNQLRAIVLEVDAFTGQPSGTPLWQSDPFQASNTSALSEFLFQPTLPVTNGTEYFIGIDSGVLTDVTGGDFTIGLASGDPLAGGRVFYRQNNAPFWLDSSASDVASRIIVSRSLVPTPEPSTALLVGMGLAFFGARKRFARV
jgi:hypothetical protein